MSADSIWIWEGVALALNVVAAVAVVTGFLYRVTRPSRSSFSNVTLVSLASLPLSSAVIGLALVVADPSLLGPDQRLGWAVTALSLPSVAALGVMVALCLKKGTSWRMPRAAAVLGLCPLGAAVLGLAHLLAYPLSTPSHSSLTGTGLGAFLVFFLLSPPGTFAPRRSRAEVPGA
jgi:hypothetical protein